MTIKRHRRLHVHKIVREKKKKVIWYKERKRKEKGIAFVQKHSRTYYQFCAYFIDQLMSIRCIHFRSQSLS